MKASDVDIDELGKAENAEVGPDIDQLSRSECQGQTNGGSIGGVGPGIRESGISLERPRFALQFGSGPVDKQADIRFAIMI